MTADQLELYFMSDRSGNPDIWASIRQVISDPWSPPQRIDELSSSAHDKDPALSSDGLTIWFTSDRAGPSTGRDIWSSSRTSRNEPWNPPVRVDELSSDADDRAPTVDETGTLLFFSSDRPNGNGDLDLYASRRSTTADPWGPPFAVRELETPAADRDPCISGNGLQIFWAAGNPLRIESATRLSRDASFSRPIVISSLGASSHDPALSPDLTTIFFASDRSGNSAIYEACIGAGQGRGGDAGEPPGLPISDRRVLQPSRQ